MMRGLLFYLANTSSNSVHESAQFGTKRGESLFSSLISLNATGAGAILGAYKSNKYMHV